VGEALCIGGGRGVGGRGDGRRRQGALTGGGATPGVAGSDTHRRGRRGAEEAGVRCQVGRREVRIHGVGQATRGWAAQGQELRCRSGGVRSGGWRGVGQASWRTRAGVNWTIGSR
jgi:hypothetical protein